MLTAKARHIVGLEPTLLGIGIFVAPNFAFIPKPHP
jgi:hypothetical protein